jgi:hypothetical protein
MKNEEQKQEDKHKDKAKEWKQLYDAISKKAKESEA